MFGGQEACPVAIADLTDPVFLEQSLSAGPGDAIIADALAALAAAELPWDDPDPLRTALERLVAHQPPTDDGGGTSADGINSALADWLLVMAHGYNDGHRFTLADRIRAIPSPVEPSE